MQFLEVYNTMLIILSALILSSGSAFMSLLKPIGNILLMDHLNINHQKSRHDLLKSFYVDVLGLILDPRKAENIEKGRKTIWVNAGITQFHLPEEECAQVFDGVVTLAYKDNASLQEVISRLQHPPNLLQSTSFSWSQNSDINNSDILVKDPWGSQFRLLVDPNAQDDRGSQPSAAACSATISDLCFYVPRGTALDGIARFYEQILLAPCQNPPSADSECVSIIVSPHQTLTFQHSPNSLDSKLRDEDVVRDASGKIVSHTGPHISMYVRDLPETYQRASAAGALFVNTRFKRQAHTLDDAVDQCMFRTLDIIDPKNPAAGVLFRLEHEIRSVVNRDGTKYKSCPFYEVPSE